MSVISASDVKRLRDITGAGMMDCKQALTESGGDFDGAIEFLRKKGQKMATKRADREANEGVVLALVSDDRTRGVIVKLSCETDFVAKNEDFIKLTEKFGNIALADDPVLVLGTNHQRAHGKIRTGGQPHGGFPLRSSARYR